jgi:DNA topoisomerase VI subunit B
MIFSWIIIILVALMFCLSYNCGLEQALIWSKMSTGLPIEIKSSMKGQNYTSFCRLDIDIHK